MKPKVRVIYSNKHQRYETQIKYFWSIFWKTTDRSHKKEEAISLARMTFYNHMSDKEEKREKIKNIIKDIMKSFRSDNKKVIWKMDATSDN